MTYPWMIMLIEFECKWLRVQRTFFYSLVSYRKYRPAIVPIYPAFYCDTKTHIPNENSTLLKSGENLSNQKHYLEVRLLEIVCLTRKKITDNKIKIS